MLFATNPQILPISIFVKLIKKERLKRFNDQTNRWASIYPRCISINTNGECQLNLMRYSSFADCDIWRIENDEDSIAQTLQHGGCFE